MYDFAARCIHAQYELQVSRVSVIAQPNDNSTAEKAFVSSTRLDRLAEAKHEKTLGGVIPQSRKLGVPCSAR